MSSLKRREIRDHINNHTGPSFVPIKPTSKETKRSVLVQFTPEDYELLKQRAEESGVSMKSYARQAISFAMEHQQ